jgi:hypothetical protein
MYTKTRYCLFLLLFIVQFSFAQQNILEKVPADATYVLSLHNSSIENKIAWEQLSQYQFIEEGARMIGPMLGSKNGELIRSATLEPNKHGIDFKGNNYAFVQMLNETELYLSLVVKLTDIDKFKTLVDAYLGEGVSEKAVNRNNYNLVSQERIMIAWQREHAVIAIFSVNRDFEEDDADYQERLQMEHERLVDRLNDLSPSNSLAQDKAFTEWDNEISDMGIWINYAELMQMSMQGIYNLPSDAQQFARQLMPLLIKMYEQMNMGMDLSFEKGALKANTRIYSSPEMMELGQKMTKNKINNRLLKYIDGENAVAYSTLSYSPEGIYQGWKEYAIQEANKASQNNLGGDLLKEFFGIIEIFIDEKSTFGFLKGDMLIAFNGIKTQKVEEIDYVYNEETDLYEEKKEMVEKAMPIFTFALSYSKKEDMMKFIRIFEKLGVAKEAKKNLYKLDIPMGPSAYIKLDKGALVISNDEERLLENKKYAKIDKFHKQQIKNHMQTVYFSPDAAIKAVTNMVGQPPADIAEVVKNIEDGLGDIWLVVKKPQADDTHTHQELTVDLANKEEYAIKQLFDFLNRIYLKQQKGI